MKTDKSHLNTVLASERALRSDLLKTRCALSKLCQVQRQASILRFNLRELGKLNLIDINKVFVGTTHVEQIISSLSKEDKILVERIKQHQMECKNEL